MTEKNDGTTEGHECQCDDSTETVCNGCTGDGGRTILGKGIYRSSKWILWSGVFMAAAGLCSAYVAYCIDRSLSTAYKTLAGGDTLYVFDDVMGMTVSHAFAMGAFLVFCFFAVINAISWWKLRRLVDDGPPHYETAMKSTFDGSAMYVIVYDEPEIRLTNGYVYGGFTSIDSPESEDAVENCSWTTEAEDKNEELEND